MVDADWFYLSTERMTIAVAVIDDVVVFVPPIARKFLGQSSYALGAWMRKQPGFRVERLPCPTDSRAKLARNFQGRTDCVRMWQEEAARPEDDVARGS